MKKLILLSFLFIISINANISFSNTLTDNTLNFQIYNSVHHQTNKSTATTKLLEYINTDNPQIKKGMKFLLQNNIYQKYLTLNKRKIILDGNVNDWINVPDQKQDKRGDTPLSNQDLVKTKYYIDKNYNLFVMHKTAGRPILREKNQGYRIWIRHGDYPKLRISFSYGWRINRIYVRVKNNGITTKLKNVNLKYSIKNIAECRISLSSLFKRLRLKMPEYLFISSGVSYKSNRKTKFDTTRYIKVHTKPINYALTLLLHLMENNCYLENDSISIALALTNSYFYSIADERTRHVIKSDIVKHFRLYKKIINWQKGLEIKYDLSKAGVIPKIFWCYRKRSMDRVKSREKLTLPVYLEFIDRIETLEEIHNFAKKLNLFSGPNFKAIAHKIEKFVKSKNSYRSKLSYYEIRYRLGKVSRELYLERLREVQTGQNIRYYFGKKRIWSHFSWVNYQWKYLKKHNTYIGDCGTVTTMQMVFFKACGIPALSLQRKPINTSLYSHNFPAHYNVFLKKWDTVQIPTFKNVKMFLYYSKPIWHHKTYNRFFKKDKHQKTKYFSNYYQGFETTTKEIARILTIGINDAHIEQLLLSDKTMQRSLFLKRYNSKINLRDSDGDGILNIHERLVKTSINNPDTDNDGYSDIWEYERNFNPNKSTSPNNSNIMAIDGLLQKTNSIKTILDVRGDSIATAQVYDVKSISAKIYKQNIYVAIKYYNDIRKNTLRRHSFNITAFDGNKKTKYWVQWNKGKGRVYLRHKVNGKNKFKKIGKEGLQYSQIKCTEFLIPLKYFKNAKTLYIQYYASGMKNGKRKTSCDKSQTIRIALKDDIYHRLGFILKDRQNTRDPEGDTKGVKNIYDIQRIFKASYKNRLAFYVRYHNDISKLPLGCHTFSFYDRKRKYKWWIQIVRPTYCSVNVYHKRKKIQKVKLSLKFFEVLRYRGGLVFFLHKNLFPGASNLELRYYTSARDINNKRIFRADGTNKILVNLNNIDN